jgi:hypothetical protein
VWTAQPVAGYEQPAVNLGRIIVWAIGLIVGIGVVLVIATIMLLIFASPTISISVPPPGVAINQAVPTPLPPPPNLETTPGQSSEFVRSREESQLTTYGYLDRSKGIVRIPIDQAINLVAQRGLPTRPNGQIPPDAVGAPSDSSSGRQPQELLH